MIEWRVGTFVVLGLLGVSSPAIQAQGIPRFELRTGTLQLAGAAQPYRFINAVGERSGIWGYENGRLEAWAYPLKIFRDFHLAFQTEGSPGIHLGDDIVRSVRVYPHMVQLSYVTEQFSVTQTIFVPRQEAGVVMLLDVRARTALRVFARFRPELDLMWPAGIGGQGASWNETKKYIRLAEPSGRFSALIGSPAAVTSTAVGYRPYLTDKQPHESLELHISAETARQSFVPIIIAGGIRDAYEADGIYEKLLDSIPQMHSAALQHYVELEANSTEFHTPDPVVNEALRWARVSLEQLKVCNPDLGCSYVSGYGSSGTGTRPMYAWFFDEPVIAAWSQLAYGDAAAVKLAFRFLRKYQRNDGKLAHEVPQSAAYVDWFDDYPFAYIHPDSPLWYLVSMRHFYRFTGDEDFVKESWPSMRKAYGFCLSILDSGDGLLRIPAGEWGSTENAAFTKDAAMAGGWIAALRAMTEFSRLMGDDSLARECEERERQAAASLERVFWNPELEFYHYGLDTGGKPVTHLNPMIAYSAWFGSLPHERARSVLERLSTAQFLADWGQRSISLEDPRYQESSYQTGSVWPFMTAATILANFRYHNPVQGFLIWRSMIDLRYLNARGAMPEALSGSSYHLLSRSVPHQMFSEHAAIPGLVNGILGLDLDVPNRTLAWTPQLPPQWPEVSLRRFPFGKHTLDLDLRQSESELTAIIENTSPQPLSLEFSPSLLAGAEVTGVLLDGKPLEFGTKRLPAGVAVTARAQIQHRSTITVRHQSGVAIEVVPEPLLEGEPSRNLRVIRCSYEDRRLDMVVEGRPERPYEVRLHTSLRPVAVEGARVLSNDSEIRVLEMRAPEAVRSRLDNAGYVRWNARIEFLE